MKIKTILVFFIFLFAKFYIYSPFIARAAGACTVSITPTSVLANATTELTFNMNNTGDANIIYIKITTPSGNFSIVNVSATGWNNTKTSSVAELTDGSLAAGGNLSISLTTQTSDTQAASANWTIEAYGGAFFNCTGTLGTAISGAADTTAPTISAPTVSGLSSSGVTVTWTTNEASETQLDYGLTPNYGTTSLSTTTTTSHSVVLTGLSANTTYYYALTSRDASGNSSYYPDHSFTTSAAPTTAESTATPTPTATATPTSTTAATPTATPFVDRVAPVVVLNTEFTETYETPPFIEGTATDAIGVTQIDFSIDAGANWLPVDQTDNLGNRSVTFSFTPEIYEDGNYDIQVRALDDEGNTGTTEFVTIVIDRLPPRVGGNLLTLGPLSLAPNENGVIVTIPGLEQRVTLSTVGGATSVDLMSNGSVSSLGFSPQIGLWTGALNFSKPGEYQLSARAIDGAGNKTERDLNRVVVVDPGKVRGLNDKVVEKGEITVYVRNPQTRLWSLWNGSTFGQDNPQNLIEGGYQYFLPPGTYYLTITSSGNPKLTSKIFTIEQTRPVTVDFKHLPRSTFGFGPIQIPLPAFMSEKASVNLNGLDFEGITHPLVGQNLPRFILPSTNGDFGSSQLIGERAILTFISTWSPASLEQVPILDAYLARNNLTGAIILNQESLSKAIVFKKRGNYSSEFISDHDGELVEDYAINFLPMHFFIDRRGVVQKVITGVLTEPEIEQYLSDL